LLQQLYIISLATIKGKFSKKNRKIKDYWIGMMNHLLE